MPKQLHSKSKHRPLGVSALSIFFLAGAIICAIAITALLFPKGFLDPIWRLNPRGHEGFLRIGGWAIALLTVVACACTSAALGLWLGRRWGHVIAVGLIGTNLIGDILNVLFGTEPRAIIGVPIAGGILIYLMSQRVRRFFYRTPVEDSGVRKA